MTIHEYLKKLPNPSMADAATHTTEIWSNSAALGYLLHAIQMEGIDMKTQTRLMNSMYAAFDELTIDEAEQKYTDA